MRTMKRVAAVALSVVVLMTSGVSAKAAVTDVQPAKSKEEAVEKTEGGRCPLSLGKSYCSFSFLIISLFHYFIILLPVISL